MSIYYEKLLSIKNYVFPSSKGTDQVSVDATVCRKGRSRSTDESIFKKWESYSVYIQSILIWEDPIKSITSIVCMNILYWFIMLSNISLMGVCSTAGLAYFWHDQWVNQIWPEIRLPPKEPEDTEGWTPLNPEVLQPPELETIFDRLKLKFTSVIDWLIVLRSTQPTFFCLLMNSFFIMLAFIGYVIPGAELIYIILMFVMSFRGFKFILPQSVTHRIERFFRSALRNCYGENVNFDSDLAEFLPNEETLEAQAALHVPLISQDIKIPEETSIKAITYKEQEKKKKKIITSQTLPQLDFNGTSYFTEGLPQDFPSYDHDSMELDGDISLPDYMPSITMSPRDQESQQIPTQSGAKSPQGDIKFIAGHFASSSEEEEEFVEGLNFKQSKPVESQHYLQPQIQISEESPVISSINTMIASSMAQNASEVISSLGQNLLASMIGGVPQPPPPQQSRPAVVEQRQRSQDDDESTSDFELISDEEFH